ncbi:hypothetical protein L218DRAFT_867712 [Marasmius fiardii PR-910]|nr:hypothetical protein L218DRAFT_867712 [Marasmius fiardii PR-910]
MKGLTRLPLDDDIVDRILIFSPDFVTLNNIILTAKAFYNVYICHPKSITRAVAYNVVGPALPQALRAIRCPVQDQENSNAEPPEDELGDAWDAETGEYGPILPQEVTHLVKNAKAFKGLEENFSLRHKNRRFKDSSQLTFTESYRFQGALYRIMLYCRIFYGPKYVEITDEFVNEDDDEENRDLLDRLNKERKKRKQFLEAYSDEQLLQILSVSRFLKEVFFWAGGSARE